MKLINSGSHCEYYHAQVEHPENPNQAGVPYEANCEDVIKALNLTFDEACEFKSIWRRARARQGFVKAESSAVRDAAKALHYAGRVLRTEQQKAAAASATVDATCEAGPETCGTTRYDWSIPSERFKWLALTAAGEAVAFTHEPTRDRHEWKPTTGEYRRFPSLDQFDATDEDWTQTLEARPV